MIDFFWRVALVLACVWLTGCTVVQPYEREYLADPTMQATDEPLQERATRKMHTAREGASGGDGEAAGGGCGCAN